MRVAEFVLLIAILFGLKPTLAGPADDAFSQWAHAEDGRARQVEAFEAYLNQQGVSGVLPVSQLLLNATSWRDCIDSPYSMPPRALWKNVVPTLRFIASYVVPALGPVQAVSGYRSPRLNACAGGAAHSAHALYFALDLVPLRTMTRSDLIASVCRLHARFGAAAHVGLGFYQGLRFHIDTFGFRRWGADYHRATSPCAGRHEPD
jgi:hypothetical protein